MGIFSSSLKSVDGDVALITGGAMGIGRLMAFKFAKLGAHVVIWDLNEELGAKVLEEIRALGPNTRKAHFYKVDVTDRELVYKTAEDVISKLGGVDILVNNAGIVGGKPILECVDAVVQKTMDVNATSHFWTLKAFLPHMIRNNKGNVVSIASAAGIFGSPFMVDYCASKFAAVGVMVSLRQELQAMGKDGVHCTVVCPSYIKTGMFEGVQSPTDWLTPEYVAESVVTAVRRDQWRVLLPGSLWIAELIGNLLPLSVGDWLDKQSGTYDAMRTFKQTRPHAAIAEDSSKKTA